MRDNSRKVSPLEINGAKIVLRRNFSGDVIVTKSGSWNQEGKRTFNIELDQELADMLEVMYAIAEARGWSVSELEAVRREKAEKRGAFEKRIFLERVNDDE